MLIRNTMVVVVVAMGLAGVCVAQVRWQYYVPFDRVDRAGKPAEPGKVYLWMPPECKTLRGLLVGGQLGIEGELAIDPAVRAACTDSGIGIVYFQPHISGVFHYWENGNTDGARWLKAFEDLAARTNHPEIRRVPWITMGHSTAGIFCRNVAYWQPQRVAAVVHIKSGNFHQKDLLPPNASFAGVPLVAINGQFETFGPEGGIRPELGRQTQWIYCQKDLQALRQKDANYLVSMLVHPGDDHFHGAPELGEFVATFLRKTAKYRLPAALPPGDEPAKCLPLKAEEGWLSDPDLNDPRIPAAPFAKYPGDKAMAMWHYDAEMADAAAKFDRNLAKHQAIDNPTGTWLDDGGGWTLKVHAAWLDAMPDKIGGSLGGQKVGHSPKPFVFRCKQVEPVEQIGPDTFRLLRPAKSVNIAAFHPGDDQYRATVRWGGINVPAVKGKPQTIDFPAIADVRPGASVPLAAKAGSGLPVYYEVEYGLVVVKEGKFVVADLPAGALPIECKITAHQIGKRTDPAIAPAASVSQVFKVVE